LLVGIVLFEWLSREQRRVDRAIAAIRARGEPVDLHEIVVPPGRRGSRYEGNAARFREAADAAFSGTFSPDEIDAYVEGRDPSEDGSETSEALRKLASCLRSSSGATEVSSREGWERWERMDRSLAGGTELSSCDRLAHEARRLCLESTIPAATELCTGDP